LLSWKTGTKHDEDLYEQYKLKMTAGTHLREKYNRGVEIVLKKNQRTGKRTVGTVKDILTSSSFHSRGIKVRLDDGQIGRVQEIFPDQS
jgi:uncharacterized repeat protein (TIGR03833 family)